MVFHFMNSTHVMNETMNNPMSENKNIFKILIGYTDINKSIGVMAAVIKQSLMFHRSCSLSIIIFMFFVEV